MTCRKVSGLRRRILSVKSIYSESRSPAIRASSDYTVARTIESIEADALQLSESERFELIERLTASLPMDPEIEAAWTVELERRLEELKSGQVQTISWEDARKTIEQDLARHRADRASS